MDSDGGVQPERGRCRLPPRRARVMWRPRPMNASLRVIRCGLRGPPSSAPPSLRISGPQQSAASRGEIKRNVRFDGGVVVDAQPHGRRRREGGKIPFAMLEMWLRAMPCHPYLMAQFMVQDGPRHGVRVRWESMRWLGEICMPS